MWVWINEIYDEIRVTFYHKKLFKNKRFVKNELFCSVGLSIWTGGTTMSFHAYSQRAFNIKYKFCLLLLTLYSLFTIPAHLHVFSPVCCQLLLIIYFVMILYCLTFWDCMYWDILSGAILSYTSGGNITYHIPTKVTK